MRKFCVCFSFSIIYILSFFAMPMSAHAATSSKCPGEEGYIFTNYRGHATRNPTNGGFVSDSAFVEDSAYIAPTAAVCNSASVLKYARVYGSAIVRDEAEITDKARVYGNARVSGTAFVGGTAKVSDHAQVSGEAIVQGVTWVRGYTKVSSGVIAEGTKKSAKPQSVINAEKQAAAAETARLAAEREREQQRALKAEAKQAVKEFASMLGEGDYYYKNFKRQAKTTISWSVDRADGNSCKIVMNENAVETGLRSGKVVNRNDNTLYFDISSQSLYSANRDYEGGGYCLETRDRDEFCYRSARDRRAVEDRKALIKNKYCKLL